MVYTDDAQIVDLYWRRDEAAIGESDKKYGRYLMKIAFRVLANFEDSQECVNDTYLKAWNSMPPHKPDVLSTYLGKIARQVSIDVYRKRASKKRQGSQYALSLSELGECVPGGVDPEREYNASLLAETVDAFLRSMPSETRAAFVGRYFYMDSTREVAGYCGMSESKLKSLLRRTRLKLKEHLEKEGFLP
ncbi:MAG: RNA polymerase sigma factor [Oscillospiraceae bacterium]|nr:RNA polymerase sigma factor [Oscillospiraceae bacterium]